MYAILLNDEVYATFQTEEEADAFLVKHFTGTEGRLTVVEWTPEE